MPSSTLAGLSLRDLEYVLALARLGHFGRAAAACGVSQPGLSEQIRKLEQHLGVDLFERSPRHVRPTPRGLALIPRIEQLVGAAREFLELAQAAGRPLTGRLRLGVIATLGPYYMPRLLPSLRARFPLLDLRLEEGRTAGLLDQLRAAEIDALLLALPAPDEALAIETLFFEPFRLLCPAGHRLSRRPRVRLADLRGEELLLLEDGHCLREQALSLCRARVKTATTRFASSLEMLRHMIALGEGYSLFPLMAILGRDELGGLLATREIAEPEAGRTIGLAWRRSDPRGSEFRELAAFLRAERPLAVDLSASAGARARG